MNKLSVFAFKGQEVRFVDGKPVANDVAAILGYTDPAKAVSVKVKPKNKGLTKMVTPGGTQSVTVLEKPGIYQLIFGSKLPAAQQFQDWVFEEVLPSIEKTGSYSIHTPQTYIEALKALVAAEEQKELLKAENQILEEENHHLSEVVDELFDFSSIIRIAKFNQISETNFKWQKLKAASSHLGIEVKKVPCPRFVTRNLYAHEAWQVAYPWVKFPDKTKFSDRQNS